MLFRRRKGSSREFVFHPLDHDVLEGWVIDAQLRIQAPEQEALDSESLFLVQCFAGQSWTDIR